MTAKGPRSGPALESSMCETLGLSSATGGKYMFFAEEHLVVFRGHSVKFPRDHIPLEFNIGLPRGKHVL